MPPRSVDGMPNWWPNGSSEPRIIELALARLEDRGLASAVENLSVSNLEELRLAVELSVDDEMAHESIRSALAPAHVDIVYYAGSFSALDDAGQVTEAIPDARCGVCGDQPAERALLVTSPPEAPIVLARDIHICEVCFALAVAHRVEELSARSLHPEIRRQLAEVIITAIG